MENLFQLTSNPVLGKNNISSKKNPLSVSIKLLTGGKVFHQFKLITKKLLLLWIRNKIILILFKIVLTRTQVLFSFFYNLQIKQNLLVFFSRTSKAFN